MSLPPRVLVIAGSDSSGGAGIQADIKTITMLGGYAMTAITAVTAQNSQGVDAVEVLDPALVVAQIDACLNDIGADAIKIGMLGSAANARAVADRLWGIDLPVVFDPVMIATSGGVLADEWTVAAFDRLMRIATLTTPNRAEFEALGGDHLRFSGRYRSCLVTGGDGSGPEVEDRLWTEDGREIFWSSKRIDTRHNHGTGCTLSSAIATYLARGMPFEDAITLAREFVQDALRAAPGFGQGNGPLGHAAAFGTVGGKPR